MTTEEKMIWMYEQVAGKLDKKYRMEVVAEWHSLTEEYVLELSKNGEVFARYTKADLAFEYLTRDIKGEDE